MTRNNKTATTGKTTSKAGFYDEETGLKELFVDELKDIYWAEKHLSKWLPKTAKAASSGELTDSIQDHLDETDNHINRIEQIFDMLNVTVRGKKCEAMEGIVKEVQYAIDHTEKGTATRDAALIISLQKAEHYEIASYGSLVQLAKTMRRNDVADILQQTLNEEKQADVTLTELAVSSVNISAEHEL